MPPRRPLPWSQLRRGAALYRALGPSSDQGHRFSLVEEAIYCGLTIPGALDEFLFPTSQRTKQGTEGLSPPSEVTQQGLVLNLDLTPKAAVSKARSILLPARGSDRSEPSPRGAGQIRVPRPGAVTDREATASPYQTAPLALPKAVKGSNSDSTAISLPNAP